MSLHYEALCADPAGVLDRIASFVGIEPGRMQQGFRGSDSHIIGNKRRMKGLSEIREDLSWKTTPTTVQLDTIARVAGPTSHRMGYNWP
jgi:hypothetical protein